MVVRKMASLLRYQNLLKKIFSTILIIGIVFFLFQYRPEVNKIDIKEMQVATNLIKKEKMDPDRHRVILLWNSLWGKKNWGFSRLPSVDFISQGCEETNCIVSDDRKLLRDADAVVFHGYSNMKDIPPFRLPHQRYVFLVHEPPCNIREHSYDYLNAAFNWTQTYRLDADIPMPYGIYCERHKPKKISFTEIVKKKTKLVAWMVSNCKTASKRLEYVRELMKYIPVDVYGKCAKHFRQNNQCGRDKSDECMQMLDKEYKFYLGFENCLTEDYITEKYFNMLSINIVPVVRGDGNYSRVGPPNSFINSNYFKTPKDLASYLLEVANDDKKYVKYLDWKQKYIFDTDNSECLGTKTCNCLLCKKLNDPSEPIRMYKDIKKWHGTCREPDDIPNMQ